LVFGSLAQPDEAALLEGLDQASDVAGIEPQTPAQVPEVRSGSADLVQQTRFAQRAITPQEMIIQCSGALGDEAIEAPDLSNVVSRHWLTLVRYVRTVKPTGGRRRAAGGARVRRDMLGGFQAAPNRTKTQTAMLGS
jgi:hypothetical protein